MSRSFNNGTPTWAKVLTRPIPRRFSERALIASEVKEDLQVVQDEIAQAEKEYVDDYVYRGSPFDTDDDFVFGEEEHFFYDPMYEDYHTDW